jgi:hypothetical protein
LPELADVGAGPALVRVELRMHTSTVREFVENSLRIAADTGGVPGSAGLAG